MSSVQAQVIDTIASQLEMDRDKLLSESLRAYLQLLLRRTEAEMFKLKTKYGVKTAAEMDDLYRQGVLEEEGSWEDFFKLDHLEYRHKKILQALDELNELH